MRRGRRGGARDRLVSALASCRQIVPAGGPAAIEGPKPMTDAAPALDPATSNVRTARDAGVMTITIHRPEKKNALTQAMYLDLAAALDAADADPEIGAAVLTGAGGDFTAGNDLGDFMRAGPHAATGEGLDAPFELLRRAATLDTPLIAAVEGVAVGIGSTILLHCDLAVAAPSARFKTPFIDLGLCPEGASSLLMPALLGRAATVRFLMLGETVPAEEARAWGLLDAIDDAPLPRAQAIAADLAAKPREAMRATKRLIREARGSGVLDAIEREGRVFAERLGAPEAQAAFAAFFKAAAAKSASR